MARMPGRPNRHGRTVRGLFRSVPTTAETAMSNGFQSRPKGEPASASGPSIATVQLVLHVVGRGTVSRSGSLVTSSKTELYGAEKVVRFEVERTNSTGRQRGHNRTDTSR